MEGWRRNPVVFWVVGLPPSVWLLVFFLIPLAFVWLLSFGESDGLTKTEITGTLSNYARAVEPLYLAIFGKSFFYAGITTVISLIVGFPVAIAIVFASPKWRAILPNTAC